MEIIRKRNCELGMKHIAFVLAVTGAITVISICTEEDELYE